MAEKRVSVRLAVVGGREVRAELHGVGEAGEKGFTRLSREMEAANERVARYVPEAERAAVASRLFGDRAALTFLRIDTATLRTATQDVRDFGVVVSQADAAQIERTNDAISRLGLIWRGLSNQLAVADALAAMARTTGPLGQGIRLLFDNLAWTSRRWPTASWPISPATPCVQPSSGRWPGRLAGTAGCCRRSSMTAAWSVPQPPSKRFRRWPLLRHLSAGPTGSARPLCQRA